MPPTKTKKNKRVKRVRSRQGPRMAGTGPMGAAPVALNARFTGGIPKVISSARGCRVVHKEFVTAIKGDGDTSFSAQVSTFLNPGNSNLFPWLQSIARNYDSYRFHKLIFYYIPRCPTTTAGTIAMCIDPDVGDPTPKELRELLNMRMASDGTVWAGQALSVPAGALNEVTGAHFVDTTGTGSGTGSSDQHIYNAGYFTLATEGVSSRDSLGNLIVEYDVEFHNPETHPTPAATLSAVSPYGAYPFGLGQSRVDRLDGETRTCVPTLGACPVLLIQGTDQNGSASHQIIAAEAPVEGELHLYVKASNGENPVVEPDPHIMDFDLAIWGNDSTADKFEVLETSFNFGAVDWYTLPPQVWVSNLYKKIHMVMKAGQFVRLIYYAAPLIANFVVKFVFLPMASEIISRVNNPELAYAVQTSWSPSNESPANLKIYGPALPKPDCYALKGRSLDAVARSSAVCEGVGVSEHNKEPEIAKHSRRADEAPSGSTTVSAPRVLVPANEPGKRPPTGR